VQAYVSLWSADLLNVGADIDRVEAVADGFHIDITDGHLTPQLLFGPDFVAAVRRRTMRPIDVHLMVSDADAWVPRFIDAGADMVTVHRRSTPDLQRILAAIRGDGAVPSLAVEVPEPVPDASAPEWLGIGRVLLMGTEIGIKGMDVDPHVYDRIRQAVAVRETVPHRPTVVVDGGIRHYTVPHLAAVGADGVIPGSLVYAVDDPVASIAWLHGLHASHSQGRSRQGGR